MNWIMRIFDFFPLKFAPSSAALQREQKSEILDLLAAYFEEKGGVSAVLKRFESAGFKGKVRSWTHEGQSRAINSVEALQLIGWKDLRALAGKAGLPVDTMRDLLAEALPVAVRKSMGVAQAA